MLSHSRALVGFVLSVTAFDAGAIHAPKINGASEPSAPGVHLNRSLKFHAGERLTYEAHVDMFRVGSASLSVVDIEDVRGRAAYHTVFDAHAHLLFFHARNHTESWFDTTTLSSLRLSKIVDAGDKDDTASYEFYSERGVYVRNGEARPSVSDPVDEGSLLYFVRTLPLKAGDVYTINRFYRRDRNPIVIRVLGRDQTRVPAGRFACIVLSVAVKSGRLLGEDNAARLWLSDDPARLLLRVESKLRFGTLRLELTQADDASPRAAN